MVKGNFFERVEEAFISRAARTACLLAVALALLGVLAGLVLVGWGLTAVRERVVAKPSARATVALSVDDIKREMEAADSSPVLPPAGPASVVPAPTRAPDEAAFNERLEAFKELMPAPLYIFESRGRGYSLSMTLDQLLADRTVSEKAEILGSLGDVLKAFPEAERLAPFQAFARLYPARESDRAQETASRDDKYRRDVVVARAEHEAAVENRALARYRGIILVAGGVVAVGFAAILLVLLAQQRLLREIADGVAPRENEAYR